MPLNKTPIERLHAHLCHGNGSHFSAQSLHIFIVAVAKLFESPDFPVRPLRQTVKRSDRPSVGRQMTAPILTILSPAPVLTILSPAPVLTLVEISPFLMGSWPGWANFFFWTRFQLRNFSQPAGVRVHPNFVVHLQSSSEVCCL